MRVFLDANVRFTAAKLPIVRAAHACKANVLLTGDHRDFVLRDDAHAAFSAGVCLLDVQGPADLSAWLAANT